jgi:cytochrome c biogenesis protein CcdA
VTTPAELGLSFVAGSLTTLSPCVFPLLPLVVGGAMQGNRLAPVAMGLGMAVAFAVLGVLVGVAGPALGLDPDAVRVAGALLLVAFGVVLLVPALNAGFTRFLTPVATSASQASAGLDAGSLSGAFLVGGLLGMVWSPCSGPLLASALTLVASDGGAARGGMILGLFGAGAAIPLIVVAYASRAGFQSARAWVVRHGGAVKRAFGVFVLLLGVAILVGADKRLEAIVLDLLPEAWVDLTTRY